jgi:hypothetical protein
MAMRARGKAALERERQLQSEKRELEEAIKQVERKKQVWAQEAQIAHDNAGRFREHQSVMSTHSLKTADLSTLKAASVTDYAHTRFHNAAPYVQRQFEEEVEKLKGAAFDKAKEEQTRKGIAKAQKENRNMHNEAAAKARGKEALQKVVSERDKRVFELEMKRLQVKEGMIKIKEARKGEEHVSSVMQERKDK